MELVQNWECYSHGSGVKSICSMVLCGKVGGVKVETSLCEGICDVILELMFLLFFSGCCTFCDVIYRKEVCMFSLSPSCLKRSLFLKRTFKV